MTFNMAKQNKKDAEEPQHSITLRVWDIDSVEKDADKYQVFVDRACIDYDFGVCFTQEDDDTINRCADYYFNDCYDIHTKLMVCC